MDTTGMTAASGDSSDPEIVRLEEALRAAQLAGDVAALDELIADDLLFTGPDGALATKAQDLEAHRSGAVRFRQHLPEELRVVRVAPGVAIAALRVRLEVEVEGRLAGGTFRYTRMWVRDAEGAWRVAGGHVSPVPAAVLTSVTNDD
jgi:ketosteroid isomerase-like protein